MAAVQATEGPVLLLAVPGSGKTTVLIARLGYMIFEKQIPADHILTLTYTVAATKDMAARYDAYFGNAATSRPEFRTINGIAMRIIQYFGWRIGKEPYRLVTDERVTNGLLSNIYREVERDYITEAELKSLHAQITCIKNGMMTEEEIRKLSEDADYNLAEIYRQYVAKQREEGWMDFDDQLTYAYAILRRSAETLQHFQEQYPYICVDEAQDTSKVQHEIIRVLAGTRDNLFMVGDEDQSIYGFRAAYPEALLRFEEQHPGAKVLLMEENYRSNGAIVDAADRFIQQNTMRHKKHMRAARALRMLAGGETASGQDAKNAVRGISLKGRGAQYTYLAKVAADCDRETAVLYRDNESALPLVDLLEREGTPYRIRSADLAFFSNRVVLDIIHICQFALDPTDADLFLQIYYKLNSYLSKVNAMRAAESAGNRALPILTEVQRDRDIPQGTKVSCKALQTHFQNILDENAGAAINRIVNYMGYGEFLEKAGMPDSKIAILKAIASREENIETFLERLSELQLLIKEKENDSECPFILSTIHGSKGLEYDRVYLMDVADGIFPDNIPGKYAPEEEKNAYEEERRLYYVAATRAKEELNIFRFQKSTLTDDLIGAEEPKIPAAAPRKASTSYDMSKTKVYGMSTPKEQKAEGYAYEKFKESFGVGQLVEHKAFGTGVVTALEGESITVRFDGVDRKLGLGVLYSRGLLWEL